MNQSLRPPGARITRSRNQVTATCNAERLWPALRMIRVVGMGLWLGGWLHASARGSVRRLMVEWGSCLIGGIMGMEEAISNRLMTPIEG